MCLVRRGVPAGGSAGLARLLERHGDAIVADLRAHYNLPPSALLELPVHELAALLSWLPDDSALAASIAGGPHLRGWDSGRHLLRMLELNTRRAVSAKPKQAKPVPLPKAPRSGRGRVVRLRDLRGSRPARDPRRSEQ